MQKTGLGNFADQFFRHGIVVDNQGVGELLFEQKQPASVGGCGYSACGIEADGGSVFPERRVGHGHIRLLIRLGELGPERVRAADRDTAVELKQLLKEINAGIRPGNQQVLSVLVSAGRKQTHNRIVHKYADTAGVFLTLPEECLVNHIFQGEDEQGVGLAALPLQADKFARFDSRKMKQNNLIIINAAKFRFTVVKFQNPVLIWINPFQETAESHLKDGLIVKIYLAGQSAVVLQKRQERFFQSAVTLREHNAGIFPLTVVDQGQKVGDRGAVLFCKVKSDADTGQDAHRKSRAVFENKKVDLAVKAVF